MPYMRALYADTLLVNGRFLTMEDAAPNAQAVAIASGRILYVGTEAEARAFADEHTEIVDLNGRVAAPGLIECHTHPVYYAEQLCRLKLSGETTASVKNLFACVKAAAEKTPRGQWISGYGYDESKFEEGPVELTKEMLDEIAPDHPVFLRRCCGHIGVLNSCAIQACGFAPDEPDPDDGGHFFRDAEGRWTGMISGTVQGRIPIQKPTDEQTAESFVNGVQEEYFRKGITSTTDMEIEARHLRLLQKLDREGQLKIRLGFYEAARKINIYEPMLQQVVDLGLLPGFGSEKLRFLGMKFVMDGSTGGKTAAFSIPYQDDPDNYGELYDDQDELNEDMLKAAKAGLQASIHAIGDRAIEAALQSIEYANRNGADTRGLRFRLEHLESPTPEQIERIKKLNLTIGLSSAFIYALGDAHVRVLGYDRLVDAFPAKTLMDNGIPVGCNSDCPVCDVNPMRGIYAMVTRTTEKGQSFGGKKEAVTRLQALEAYTKNAAYLLYAENETGTLKAGKHADIVVFEDDFLNIPEENLKDVKVYMTMLGGEVVYQQSEK